MDSRSRSGIKSATWTVVTLTLGFLYLLLGDLSSPEWVLLILIGSAIAGTLHYLHERLWAHSFYGREIDVNVNLKVGFKPKRIKRKVKRKVRRAKRD